MLSVNSYSQDYVDECRSKVEQLIAAYRGMVSTAGDQSSIEAFEPQFFNPESLAAQ